MTKTDRPKPAFTLKPRNKPQRNLHDDDYGTDGDEGTQSDPPYAHEKLAKITGFQAVSALFRRDPNRVIRLYYDENSKKSVGDFCAQMARMQRPYRLVDESELQKISGTVHHGGVVAAAAQRLVPDLDIDATLDWAEAGEPLIILDGIGNPQNLGAIARSMAYFGLKYLLISDHPSQTGLSDAAHRIAEGGLEHIQIYRAYSIPKLFHQLREAYRIVGTSLGGKIGSLSSLAPDTRPLALVFGNEEYGLPSETLRACETTVCIRGTGQVQSLNVSATAAILIHQMQAMSASEKPIHQADADLGRNRRSPQTTRGHYKPVRGDRV